MPTQEEIEQTRERLERLRDRQRSLRGSVFDKPEVRSRGLVGGVIDEAAQGLTFGFADEIEAGIRAPFADDPFEGATISDRFRNILFDLEQKREAFRETNPITATTSQLGAAALQGVGLLRAGRSALPGVSQRFESLPFVPRLAAAGAAEGALFGAGAAQPGERLEGAAEGALFGGVGAPLLGAGVAATGAVARPIIRRLIDSFTETPRARAVGMVVKAMQDDMITPEEASIIIKQHGSGATLADIGENLSGLARTAQTIPGRGAGRARRILDQRQEGQRLRLVQSARKASATDELDNNVIDVINNAESAAAEVYQQAYGQVIDMTPTMGDLLNRPAMKRAMRIAKRKLADEGFSTEIADDVTDVRYMDMIKRSLDDQIGVANRQGRRDEVRILTQLKRQFVEEIDNQVPEYAAARDIFAGEAAIRDAIEVGKRSLRPQTSSSDLASALEGMTESELQGVRHGLITALVDQLDNVQNVTGAANRIKNTPRLREIISLAFPDRQALDDFFNRTVAESTFAQTRNRILGGSPTARIQAGQRAATPSVLDTVFDAAVGNTAGAVSRVGRMALRDDLDPEVADEIIKILLDESVIPTNLKAPLPQRIGLPRINPRQTLPGLVGGVAGSAVGQDAPQSLLDFLLQNPQ